MERFICSAYEVADSIVEMTENGATVPVYISGNSMNPFLVNGRDIVYLRRCIGSDFKKGKILLFRRSDGQLVLHRLIKQLPDGRLQVVGDGQTVCETIEKFQVIATVSEIERKGKKRSADSFLWETADFLWRLLMPLRPVIMRIWRRLKTRTAE